MGPLTENLYSNLLTSNDRIHKLDMEKIVGFLWVGLQNLFWNKVLCIKPKIA